jgi:phage recombination protein Bet
MNVPQLLEFNRSQLQVIRTMCAKECNEMEFNLFLEMCKARGLNPLLKHIYAMVLNKDKPDKRQLTIIVSVEGQRHIANRKGNYRPDDKVPRFTLDDDLIDPITNPKGLSHAEAGCYIHSHGDWHYVPHVAYWEEYAPIIEEWAENESGQWKPTGRMVLDPKKGNWRKMPRIMLAKCAEFGALRKAFPDDFGGLYGEEEMDRAHSIDLTASEILAQAAQEDRIKRIGGTGYIMDWMSGGPLESVPAGQFVDRCLAWLEHAKGSPQTIVAWEGRNRAAMQQFWGAHPGDALELRRQIDAAKQPLAPEAEPVPVRKTTKAQEKPAKPRGKDAGKEAETLPPLRLRTGETEESETPQTLLRRGAKSIRELAGKPPLSARQPGTSPGVAPGKGKAPRRSS